MPLHDFKCPDCCTTQEVLFQVGVEPPAERECTNPECEGTAKRVISSGVVRMKENVRP